MKITTLLLALVLLVGGLTGCGAESPASPSVETTTTEESLTTATTTTTTKKTTVTTTTTKKSTTTSRITTTEQTEQQVQMVWIPQSGKKYHSHADCSGMIDPQQVSLFTAKEWGYTPCKRCYG